MNPENIEICTRLVAALILGSLIGLERELSRKEAGTRTYTLVCLGSALVMIVSTQMYEIYKDTAQVDPSRIAAQVVSGIGFLGAGAIIRSRDQGGIRGLTTAAGIWVASGIGLACGIGAYVPAIMTTVLTLLTLIVLSHINRKIDGGGSKNDN